MKYGIVAIAAAWMAILVVPAGAVQLPTGLSPLHHWDAYNPNGDGIQPADGTTISNLVDLVGGNHAGLIAGGPVYHAGDASTIGGQATIRFTTADGLRATHAILDQTVTIFSVSRMKGDVNRRLITGTNPSNYLLGYWNNLENRAHNGSFFGSNAPATTNQHMYIHQARNDGSDILHDADVLIANSLGSGASGTIGRLGFGGINWSGGEASNGDISEIIIFDSDMADGDFQAAGRYLAEKYGFAAFGHDGTALGGGPEGPNDFTWTNGGGNNLWNDPANWFGAAVPGTGDTARIEMNTPPGAIDLSGVQSVGGLTFRLGTDGFSLTNGSLSTGRISHDSGGSNTLAVAVNGVDEIYLGAGRLTFSGGLALDRPLETTGHGGNLHLASVVSGTNRFTKTGNAEVILGAANTFSGVLDIVSGSVTVSTNGALGATNGMTRVQAGSSLVLADGLAYTTAEPIQLHGTLAANGTATVGAGLPITLIRGATLAAPETGSELVMLPPLDLQRLDISGQGVVALNGNVHSTIPAFSLPQLDALSPGIHTVQADGTNIAAFVEHYGGHNWLLVGRGREGWEFDDDGQGLAGDVVAGLGTTNAFAPAAYSAALINDLLAASALDTSDLVIRIKRARDPAGASYQEARWILGSATSWTWAFDSTLPVEYRILEGVPLPYFNLQSNTRDTPNVVNGEERIFTWAWGGHGGQKGFSFGSSVTNGTNNLTSFLWESANENHAMPYTEVYVRSTHPDGLYQQGEGKLVLSGTNTYTLATTVHDGTLEIRSAAALGSTNSATFVSAGAALSIGTGLAQGSLEPIVLDHGSPGGTLGNAAGNNRFDGPVRVPDTPMATVGTFSGGDPGEGLDLDGDFLYAVNVRGPGGLQVRDALFTDEASTSICVIHALNENLNWQNPQFGDSADDDQLEVLMQSIRWTPAPRSLAIDLHGLSPGEPYTLQLLFYEPGLFNRGWDIYLDRLSVENLVLDDFSPSFGGVGVVVSLDFVASEASHTVILNGTDAPYPDHNPILQALTLEQNVPAAGFPGRARLESTTGSLTLHGGIHAGSSTLTLGGAGELLLAGELLGNPDGTLHKVDPGEATLSGNNPGLQGTVLVTGGTLAITSSSALGDGGETRVEPGGSLALSGSITLDNEVFHLGGAGALVSRGGTNTLSGSSPVHGHMADVGLKTDAGTLSIDGPIDLGFATLRVDGAGTTHIHGVIGSSTPAATVTFEDAVLAAQPIAYYTFDHLVDADTLVNSGSLTNGAEILGAASIAPALHGNGLAIADNSNGIVEVNLPGTTTPNPIPLPGDGDYTLGGWFNGLHDTSSWRTFARASGGSGDHQAIVQTGSHQFGMYQGGFHYTGYNVDGSAEPPLDIRTGWHLLVVVGHSTNRTDYYIDNTYVGSVARTSRSDVWRIGAWPGQTFADRIDDFFVCDYALSAGDIDTLWEARNGLTPTNRVVKAGTGTLALSGNNTYRDGTRVLGGTLRVANSAGSGTGTNSVSVETGATLGGHGGIGGDVQVHAGGTLAPGNSPGELAVAGAVQLDDPSSTFAIDLEGPELTPLEYDRLLGGGDLALNGVLALTRDAGFTPNNSHSLVIATASGTLSGTFAGLNEGATVLDNLGTAYTISYQGNAVTLTPVDDPPSPFGVNTITFAPGPGAGQASITLDWESSSGASYRIESGPHPEGPWTPLSTGIGGQAGNTQYTEVLDSMAGVLRLYLRVVKE